MLSDELDLHIEKKKQGVDVAYIEFEENFFATQQTLMPDAFDDPAAKDGAKQLLKIAYDAAVRFTLRK